MKHNFIAESLSASMLSWISIQSSRIFFQEKSLITQILRFAMDSDKQAGLLTNLPAKSTFSSLPASSFAVLAWKPRLDPVASLWNPKYSQF